jgi:hypothetical protein
MSNGKTGDWYDLDKKNEAVYKVLEYLAQNPDDGSKRVGKDDEARQLFEEKGGIQVPVSDGARVIFFASGERALLHGASVVLEVPPGRITGATDDQLKQFVLGNYPYWRPRKA